MIDEIKKEEEKGYINEVVRPSFAHDCIFKRDSYSEVIKCVICGKIKK